MEFPTKLIGLTGGVGMGKSTAAELLAKRGIPVIDTDLLAREVVEPGQPALTEIEDAFGTAVIADDGALRRGELARRVFANPSDRETLEAILHPRIRQLWFNQAQEWRREGRPLGIVVIPLLFETDARGHFDATICVACTAPTQEQRLTQRGWTMEQIEQRRKAQWPIDRKMASSDFVIWTEGTLNVYPAQLDRVLQCA